MSRAARVEIVCLRHSPEHFFPMRGALLRAGGNPCANTPLAWVAFLCVRGIPLIATRYMRAVTEAR